MRYIRHARGFDFTGYKRASLMRRVRHRMDQAGFTAFDEYLDTLQASPDEFAALLDTILINVTSFFRDPQAWDYVRDEVVPTLLGERSPGDPIRVWSAGCASGQEAYTLAMILAEAIGIDSFRARVKIYATDIDEDALDEGRAACYADKAVATVPTELLNRYFEPVNGSYVFRNDLRRAVIFGRNDLVMDAPISRVDLLVCRNTLMYLNADTQRTVLERLHFALAARGVLFLGHAEMLLSSTDRFTPLNTKYRIFRKAPTAGDASGRHGATMLGRLADDSNPASTADLALRASPVAQIVVTGDDTVAMINQQAETTFGLSAHDVGRLLRDLEVSFRPLELPAHLEQARIERRAARIRDVQWSRPGADTVWFDIHVNPLVDPGNGLAGVSVAFVDVTSTHALLDKVVEANRQSDIAYEELRSTNEELETTNEELQSTNEELETMNEELQSINADLHTINDTLRERSVELDEATGFLDSLVGSIRFGLVIVDRLMRVVVWNRGCDELWGLRSDEVVGKPLPALDIGLPTDEVEPLIGRVLVDAGFGEDTTMDAVNRRRRRMLIRLRCTAFRSSDGSISGALLLMEPLHR